MKLSVWNVCNKADQVKAANQIEDYFHNGYGAVALQEVPYTNNMPLTQKIAKEHGLDHVFIHTRSLSLRNRNQITGYGTAVLSTASLHKSSCVTLRDDRFAYMTPGRGNQRAAIAFSHPEDPEVRFVVAHLSYALIGKIGSAGLAHERTQLQQFLKQQKMNGTLLFAGDMNCQPGGQLDDELGQIGLQHVPPTDTSSSSPDTYQSRYPGLKRVTSSLDRVYAEPTIQPQVTLGEYGPSDHRPLHISL